MQFRHDINGLRAIAVIAVVLFHFNADWLPGGFAGVDIFFVISGYLMTGIIFTGIEKNNFSLSKFFLARFNRIVPALIVLCFFVLFLGWFELISLNYEKLGGHVISSLFFVSNFLYWQESSYFAPTSREIWLLHTWSLSVEWQFYVLYPIVLVILKKFLSLKSIKALIIAATIFGFIFSIVMSDLYPGASYYLLPTRGWELLIGGVAYLYPFSTTKSTKNGFYLFALGAILITVGFFVITEEALWPGYLAAIPVIGTFLIIQANNNSYFLSNQFFQKIGACSYSIYLWHWPFAVWLTYFGYSHFLAIACILMSFLTGYLSYTFIEQNPAFRIKNENIISILVNKTTASFLLVLLLSGIIIKTNGVNLQIRDKAFAHEAQYLTRYSLYAGEELNKAYNFKCNFFDVNTNTLKPEGIAPECTQGKGGVLLWGDSHGQALSYGIRTKLPDNILYNQVSTSACPPNISGELPENIGMYKEACNKSNEWAKQSIIEIEPDILIIAQRENHDTSDFLSILQFLKDNNLKTKLLLVGPTPQWPPSLPRAIALRHFSPNTKYINDIYFDKEIAQTDKNANSKYADTSIEYLSLIDNLCNNETGCLAKVDNNNTPLVWDYGHLTLEGSVYIFENFLKHKILSILKEQSITSSR